MDKRPVFMGGYFAIVSQQAFQLAKMPIPQAVVVKYPFRLFLCSNNWSWRFSVRRLRLSHFLFFWRRLIHYA